MVAPDELANAFEAERPRLTRVAARVLVDASEAEDMVQLAWLRLAGTNEPIENLPGWLTAVTVRLCLDRLRAKVPVAEEDLEITEDVPNVADEVLLGEELGAALQVTLERLSPRERVAFVLHDSFAFDFDSIAAMLEVSPAAARKLASRARTKLRESTMPLPSPVSDWEIVDAFLSAAKHGEFERLLMLLAPDVVIGGDAAAIAMGTPERISGRDTVATFFNGAAQTAFPAFIGSRAGAAWIDRGIARAAFDFAIHNGQVQSITFRADPDVLRTVARRKDDSLLVRRRSSP
ncbi:RNA polymerase subunit sigma-70 [Neomicrococcus aestuarii]|uniref:RNA polymerase subunit sigma-70 n=1 Tax=Neomicrococcus aestuarii TaxID=556325 RepID=A0A1L2ZPB7_9MICC|nr:RNA polymerase subunit sigma-70 [Neomicrococcus aestuarii]